MVKKDAAQSNFIGLNYMEITFETKVWEKDWDLIMKMPYLGRTIERCGDLVSKRVLYINNVKNEQRVIKAANQLISKGVIDRWILVEDYAEQALSYFNLSKEKLGVGYYYSIAELVSIYLCDTKYLLHFSGDATVLKGAAQDWLAQGIKILEDNPRVVVFNLAWTNELESIRTESENEDKNFFYGYGFSDQMYLIRAADYKQKIYEYYNVASERYPKFAGELFEKRVDSWMRESQLLRATYKHGNYLHENFPNRGSMKWFIKRHSITNIFS